MVKSSVLTFVYDESSLNYVAVLTPSLNKSIVLLNLQFVPVTDYVKLGTGVFAVRISAVKPIRYTASYVVLAYATVNDSTPINSLSRALAYSGSLQAVDSLNNPVDMLNTSLVITIPASSITGGSILQMLATYTEY